MDAIQEQFVRLLSEQQVNVSEQQLDKFEIYYNTLVDWNERMNLTGITEREQVYIKHFYDSLSVSFFIPMNKVRRLADIGSGAGFPSIPLGIMNPDLKITIVDSLNKRIQFLNHLVEQLQLPNVECIHGRAEEVSRLKEHRDSYDLVTARAVARLAVLNEFCLPFVTAGGSFAAMKGNDIQDELNEAAYSLKELKAELKQVHAFQLPVEQASRHIVVLHKKGSTPAKYPRRPGTPLKQPLVKD